MCAVLFRYGCMQVGAVLAQQIRQQDLISFAGNALGEGRAEGFGEGGIVLGMSEDDRADDDLATGIFRAFAATHPGVDLGNASFECRLFLTQRVKGFGIGLAGHRRS